MKGLEIGSKTLEFKPRLGPGDLVERNINIRAESPAASALLIFQAVLPFFLFAGNESGEPIELTISGGTNVSFSLSYEYLDQVLLPTLDAFFGVRVERALQSRGWSSGSESRGLLWFKIQPLPLGSTLGLKTSLDLGVQTGSLLLKSVDVTIAAPADMHKALEAALLQDVAKIFPFATVNLILADDSKHDARIYVLLVAKSGTLRWGRDLLYNKKRKGKTIESISEDIASSVSRDLCTDIQKGGPVDEFLQDQLVIFQSLAQGRTSFLRHSRQTNTNQQNDENLEEIGTVLESLHIGGDLSKDKVRGPLGEPDVDSTHTMTARWVASEILEPELKWYNKGKLCDGVGLVSGSSNMSS